MEERDDGEEKVSVMPAESVRVQSGSERSDGFIDVRFDDKDLTAYATFTPPGDESGKPIMPELIETAIVNLNLAHGLMMDAAMDAAMDANLNRHIVHDVVIARGTPPEEEIPEHVELLPKFAQDGVAIDQKAHRVDWKDLSPFVMVDKGETIGNVISARPGIEGKDVHGKAIPFPRRQVTAWEFGEGIQKSGDLVVAATEGRFLRKERLLYLEKILAIKGAVDYHTGNVIFPGDIYIEGAVRDGFKLYSGGMIVVKSTLDASDVNAKGDLIVSGGIIGRKSGRVRVGGKLQAKFLENCHAAVKGNAEIQSEIVNSKLYVLGHLVMGEKAKVAGGEIWAVHGVRTNQAGTPSGQRTLIRAGTDFTVQQRLDLANERLKLLALKEQKAKAMMASRPSGKLEAILKEIAKMQAALSNMVGVLLQRLDADEKAVVEIRGDAYPGVTIEICRMSITLEKPQKKVRFRLDKFAGKILMEPIK